MSNRHSYVPSGDSRVTHHTGGWTVEIYADKMSRGAFGAVFKPGCANIELMLDGTVSVECEYGSDLFTVPVEAIEQLVGLRGR